MTHTTETYIALGRSVFQRLRIPRFGVPKYHLIDQQICTINPQFPAPEAMAFQIAAALNRQAHGDDT